MPVETREPFAGPFLPQSTLGLIRKVEVERRHAGLQLDKLSSVAEQKNQRDVLKEVTKTGGDPSLLDKLIGRRSTMLNALGAARLAMTTRGSLTLHLSRSGALENAGIALHPVYGFVYLPGSGIKGLARAWAETVWAAAQPDKTIAWRRIEDAFGWSTRSENHKFPQPKKGACGWRSSEVVAPEGSAAGRLVFYDAWPMRWPCLILDVVNNHHVKYYRGEDDPGDWENPTLVYFLATGDGVEFEFAISDREPKDDGLLDLACGWLKDALTVEGAGAKTAAGYGRFRQVENKAAAPVPPDFATAGFASANFDLKLATPAFLAGADQKREDCELRPATLRGLLRWWWRTMHAAYLDRDTLKRLETAVWGDAESSSPVRIAVDFMEGEEPRKHPDRKDQQFLKKHGLRTPERKMTQGLFYASYGMAEKDIRRWFRPARSLWRVILTARPGRFNGVSLDPRQLSEQAAAALWLLTQFGGAGSRTRKGFGSFHDVEVQGIGSKEDCIAAAKRFRAFCNLDRQHRHPVDAAALDEAIVRECATVWKDPWYALDQMGLVLQRCAKRLKHEERIALGLPRFSKKPSDTRDRDLSGGLDRHASPVLWSFATTGDGTLLVRLIAFPVARLKPASKDTLQNLVHSLQKELKREARQSPKQEKHSPPSLTVPPSGLPKANDRIEAELLEEKTRKGGWKAKHLGSGLPGPIQDSENGPADAKPGQHVELTVAFVKPNEIAFQWAEPPPPKKKPPPPKKKAGRR